MKTVISKLSQTCLALMIPIFGILALASCSKSSSSSNSNFSGTYAGSLSIATYIENDTLTIPASSSSTITMNTKTALGSTYSITGTVSGSTLNIGSQTVVVTGTPYTVTGVGTLTGTDLVINYVFVNSANLKFYWTFTGTKLK